MKLSEIREILRTRDIQLTKSLGQNFLHDQNQLRRIVADAELKASDQVLEIGPGLGPLTELLLDNAAHVLAIEKDARLIAVLKERFGARKSFELIHADALDVVRDSSRDWSEYKLVANLPYSVASPILVELAQHSHRPERLVATLQLEVARRLMAKGGDADYGILTLLVQLRYEPKEWFKIPRGCFFPEPDVDSACVVLLRRTVPLLARAAEPAFDRIVKRAFSQRRKTMLKLLKEDWPPRDLARTFSSMGLSPQVRGEALTLQDFSHLALRLVHPRCHE
jgi:16S rRNA (adenine1518-N6/adenine1519-N6)-dimethyltransferase